MPPRDVWDAARNGGTAGKGAGMTKQVRVTYRSHRKAAWVVMLALVGVLAAVVIPLASGQSGKTYTLSVTSSAPCASPASATATVKNTTSPQTLGSIEIYFPPNTVATVTSPANAVLRPNTTSSAQSQNKDIVAIDDLNLASGRAGHRHLQAGRDVQHHDHRRREAVEPLQRLERQRQRLYARTGSRR